MTAPLLLHIFPSFAVGGAQIRMAALASHFGPRWRHAIVALDGRVECMRRIGPDVVVDSLPFPAIRGEATARRLLRIARLLRQVRPDLLITSNWGSMEWAMIQRLLRLGPHLHTEDGFGPEESGGQFRRRILARQVILRGSDIVLPSATLLRAAREVWRLPAARLHHIANGIDIARFHPLGGKAVIPLAWPGPLVGTVAALRPEKNLARLLRAAAILLREGTALRLAIIGDGPERASLEALAQSLGIMAEVGFLGAMSDPADAYRAMDLFCLSSDTEQMPFSVLEAMASGLAVAATDVGDIGAMVAAENLPFLAPRDDAALAAALRPLLRDAALRQAVGAANRSRAEALFDQELMFAAHAALIDRLIGTARA